MWAASCDVCESDDVRLWAVTPTDVLRRGAERRYGELCSIRGASAVSVEQRAVVKNDTRDKAMRGLRIMVGL